MSRDRRTSSELALIRAIVAQGDKTALEEVSSRLDRCVAFVLNQNGWFKMASLAMREEIAAEALVRLVDRVQRGFDGSESQFKTYVYKVVYSVTSSEVKRARKTSSLDEEVPRADGSSVSLRELMGLEITRWVGRAIDLTDPLEGMARAAQAGRVARALRMLSRVDREVLRLFEVEGLSTRETARQMNLSEGNVSVKIHRARERMARAYLRTYALSPIGLDEAWIPSLIERLPRDEADVLRIWWRDGGSAREIARRLGIAEDRCRDLLDRGKASLAMLAEETPRAS